MKAFKGGLTLPISLNGNVALGNNHQQGGIIVGNNQPESEIEGGETIVNIDGEDFVFSAVVINPETGNPFSIDAAAIEKQRGKYETLYQNKLSLFQKANDKGFEAILSKLTAEIRELAQRQEVLVQQEQEAKGVSPEEEQAMIGQNTPEQDMLAEQADATQEQMMQQLPTMRKGGNITANTVRKKMLGYGDNSPYNTADSIFFPNVNNITMRNTGKPLHLLGMTNGKVTDYQYAMPYSGDYRLNGDSVLELPKFQNGTFEQNVEAAKKSGVKPQIDTPFRFFGTTEGTTSTTGGGGVNPNITPTDPSTWATKDQWKARLEELKKQGKQDEIDRIYNAGGFSDPELVEYVSPNAKSNSQYTPGKDVEFKKTIDPVQNEGIRTVGMQPIKLNWNFDGTNPTIDNPPMTEPPDRFGWKKYRDPYPEIGLGAGLIFANQMVPPPPPILEPYKNPNFVNYNQARADSVRAMNLGNNSIMGNVNNSSSANALLAANLAANLGTQGRITQDEQNQNVGIANAVGSENLQVSKENVGLQNMFNREEAMFQNARTNAVNSAFQNYVNAAQGRERDRRAYDLDNKQLSAWYSTLTPEEQQTFAGMMKDSGFTGMYKEGDKQGTGNKILTTIGNTAKNIFNDGKEFVGDAIERHKQEQESPYKNVDWSSGTSDPSKVGSNMHWQIQQGNPILKDWNNMKNASTTVTNVLGGLQPATNMMPNLVEQMRKNKTKTYRYGGKFKKLFGKGAFDV